MESSTKYFFQDTSRGQNQPSRANDPLLAGYPVLLDEPIPDVKILISDCSNSAIALAVSKLVFTGPGVPNSKIEFLHKRIGDAWVGCPTDAQAQVVTLTGSSETCCESIFRKTVVLEWWDGVQYQVQTFEKVFTCDCDSTMTEAQRVQALVDVLNADSNAIVTATRSGSNIILTDKNPGAGFRVIGSEGFINETLTVVNIPSFGTGQHLLRKGFDVSLLDLGADYNVISFVYEDKVDVANGPMQGGHGSRPYMFVEKTVWVAFASGCSSLRTALLGILNGTSTPALYIDRVATDNCNNPTPTPTPTPSA